MKAPAFLKAGAFALIETGLPVGAEFGSGLKIILDVRKLELSSRVVYLWGFAARCS